MERGRGTGTFYVVVDVIAIAFYKAAPMRYIPLMPTLSDRNTTYLLYILGICLLVFGLNDIGSADRTITYNDQRLVEAINAILLYLEGSFGALVMVCAGVGAILSAAFGQYRAALGLLVVAVGSFILRSLMSTFFNDVGIQE